MNDVLNRLAQLEKIIENNILFMNNGRISKKECRYIS